MTRITVYIKTHHLERVKAAISACGANGITVGDCQGVGRSPERAHRAADGALTLPLRSRIDLVVVDSLVEKIIEEVRQVTDAGQPDEGKIFLEKVEDAIRIRTAEHGEPAL